MEKTSEHNHTIRLMNNGKVEGKENDTRTDARELKFTNIPVNWSMLTQYIQVKPCNSMLFG